MKYNPELRLQLAKGLPKRQQTAKTTSHTFESPLSFLESDFIFD
jgi:hypothetical protein